MRKIIQFPFRPEASPVGANAASRIIGRWLRNPETGRLEQRWTISPASDEPQSTRDSADAAA